MNERFRFDAEDPFGTRPDEKPPTGWDENFFDGVRELIQRREGDPDAGRLPEPHRRGGRSGDRALAILAFALVTAASAAALFLTASPGPVDRGPADLATTIVRVSGSGDPAVAVEWARTGGRASGYVVLESFAPEVSYVVIDERLAGAPVPRP
ncbi:MAG TPA: hypothetical protein VGK94_11835 [Candidatus Polarisedimenticolia bacterium]|jgi:hypothetical protein